MNTQNKTPQDVTKLVIAARELLGNADVLDPDVKALDAAVEAFSTSVAYDDQPDD